jgi:beta-glucosidase
MSSIRQRVVCAVAVAMTVLAGTAGTAATALGAGSARTDPYGRAAALVAQMTLDEEILEAHSIMDSTHLRFAQGIPRLGIPNFEFTNGPAGVDEGRVGSASEHATALPAPISLAATFDPGLANQYGTTAGAETADWAYSMLEGPDLNIARMPLGGRTFEAFGEDPFLAGQIAANEVLGIQTQNVIANAKHYAVNEQETNRKTINEVMDERTLREIYLPAFEAVIKQGQAGSVMCSYPKLNGTFNCQNSHVLTQILKNEWGFKGFVMNDFTATHSTVADANAGHDFESITDRFFDAGLKAAVQSGQVSKARLDDMVTRRLGAWIASGSFDHPNTRRTIPAQQDGAVARSIAEQGMVLLKNSGGTLPLSTASLHRVALIGPYASSAMTGGTGSSHVNPTYTVSPRTGMQSRLGPGATVTVNTGRSLSSAAAAARAADVAVVMVGTTDGEGHDRTSLSLPGNQNALVSAVVAANPHTVVVIKSGSAVLMPWLSRVPAVLEAWYPGEEDGNAVADVLVGNANPSGKLPLTFPARAADMPANTPAEWPGVGGTATYSEGLDVGYRHYDQSSLTPLFPFGFGLSYTTFTYANLTVTAGPGSSATVAFDVTNSGARAGAEVAQVYVSFPAAAGEPPRQLKGFQKLSLQPGQTGHAQVQLDARAFSHWDTASSAWVVTPGSYQVLVGGSSRNLPLQGAVTE